MMKITMIGLFICMFLSTISSAQLYPEVEGGQLPSYAKKYRLSLSDQTQTIFPGLDDSHPSIMITGYWPPTNEMIRHFSSNPKKNPGGWQGKNWEDLGYDIYAFFPEFPNGLGKGEGDFEVDYQDTSKDFWHYVNKIKPVAIITTGRAFENNHWAFEGGAQNFQLNQWYPDYLIPFFPTKDLPISQEPAEEIRWATLPMDEMIEGLKESKLPIYSYITNYDKSAFLCNFLGYHTLWYQDLHENTYADQSHTVKASGFIHVGYDMSLETARSAIELTLRSLIDYLD